MSWKIGRLAVVLALSSLAAAARQAPQKPTETTIYCSGMITTEAVPYDTYLVSGEEANYKITFVQGDYVYINKGSRQGAQVGDEFLVTRPVRELRAVPWFQRQPIFLRMMGTQWVDLGRLRVVTVRPDLSIAQVVSLCDPMQRGDIVLPFVARPAPALKAEEKFDRFAPPSGRPIAVVAASKDFRQEVGQGDIVYVSLGSKEGAKVGDYFRIFRSSGGEKDLVYQTPGVATHLHGFGQAPDTRKQAELPREILGEGIVLRVTPTASTVLITFSLREIFAGAWAELE